MNCNVYERNQQLVLHCFMGTPGIYRNISMSLEIFHRLHQPDKIVEHYWHYSKRLPASYVNFYIANRAVIVPQFGQAKWDQAALDTLSPLFPDRDVIGVQSAEIRAGNIHCITQQVPKSKEERSWDRGGERSHWSDGMCSAF